MKNNKDLTLNQSSESANSSLKISVITAIYNRKDFIFRALSSIKNQSYKNIELVVVDGGSNDGSQKIACSFLGHDDIFISEPDNGIYDALNKGIEASSGDIIAFLHSDDLYDNNEVLANIASIFQKNEIDIVYGDIAFFSKNNSNHITRVYRSDKLSLKNLSWGKMPAHPAILIKKDIYKKIGLFKTNYHIAADYEFLCRMMKSNHVNSIYVPDIFIRMQMGGISTGGIKSTILLNREVLRACKENLVTTNILMLLSKYPSKIFQFFRK